MSRFALVVDLNRCIGCHSCEIACKNEHEVELGIHWNQVLQRGPVGEFPHLQQYFLPTMCQQCVNAPCQEVCPTGATYRDEEGKVLIDAETCIGCLSCMEACPYEVRALNPVTNTVEKCNLCHELTAEGETPRCVMACCASARFYGDLDDPNSDAAKALAAAGEENVHRLADSGNEPSTAYILAEKWAAWAE